MLYVCGVVAVLRTASLWNFDMLKDTIIWFCMSGFIMVVDFVGSRENEVVFKKIVRDNVKAVIILEFLVNTYTFSLVGELLFIPVLAFLVLLDTVAQLKKEHAGVARLTGTLLAAISLSVIVLAIWKAVGDYGNITSFESLRGILLAPLLAAAFCPFLYGLLLVTTYESAFVCLRLGAEKPSDVVLYARRRILRSFGVRLNKLRAFIGKHRQDLMRIRSTTDVDNLLCESDANSPADGTK